MTNEYQTLRVSDSSPLLTITLHRPEVKNAFDERLIAELTAVLEAARQRNDLRCLILQGEGSTFSAGADLAWMQRASHQPEADNLADARRLARLFQALDAIPFPTVAKIRGAALGGGAGLAATVDTAIAAQGTRFGFTEVRLGIIPAVISVFALRKIGRAAARRYFPSGEIFDADRAREIQLISEVVPESQLDTKVDELVRQILSVGPAAARRAKALTDLVGSVPYPAVLENLAREIAETRACPEAREGLQAFLQKRAPQWPETSP